MHSTSHQWTRIVGLDLSKRTYTGCILSGDGLEKRRMIDGAMDRGDGYTRLCGMIREGDLVVMEAGSSSFSLARFLETQSDAAEVVVLNPADLRLIWDSLRKTDRSDAVKLASFARDTNRDSWPQVSVPTEDEQGERSCITYYVKTKEEETRLFNTLFALFNTLGMPDIDKALFRSGKDIRRKESEELLASSPQALVTARMLNDRIDLVQLQLECYDSMLREICLSHPDEAVAWLSIPGIGLKTAATLVAYIGDGSRFSRPDQLVNYTGLVPRQSLSGTVDRNCHITRRGSSAVRRNIVQGASVVLMMPPTCPLTRFAYRKRMENIPRGKVAVAVATHMLRTGHALLKHDDIYDGVKTEQGMQKFRHKLASYGLQALIESIPSK